jgi:hypothetical protein
MSKYNIAGIVEKLFASKTTTEDAQDILQDELTNLIDYTENIVCDRYRLHTSVHEHRALCEHPPNTVDSILRHNLDERENFNTCQKACDVLLDENAMLTMRLGGEVGEETSVTFSDSAYGQPVDKFDRFLTLGDTDDHKREYKFLHGCRGKGHLTTLQHTNYKLVLTSTPDSQAWAFTVIYQREDGEYVYVTDGDSYIEVEGSLDLGREIGEKNSGTVLKHIGYDIPYDGSSRAGFRKLVRRFSHGSVKPFIPVRITDSRKRDYLYLYNGLLEYIEQKSDRLFDCIETGYAETEALGKLEVTCAVPKDSLPSTEAKRELLRITTSSDSTVFLTVDGQTHFKMSNSFLESRLDMDEIGSDTVVIARAVNPPKGLEDVFDDDRQSFRKSEHLNKFKQSLIDTIAGMEELKQTNVDRMVSSLNRMKKDKTSRKNKKQNDTRRLSDLDEDASLTSLFENPSNLSTTHRKSLEMISSYKNAPIVHKMMKEYSDEPTLENITEILKEAEKYSNRRSIKEGKNVEQAGKNSIGKMFEMIMYIELVRAAEESEYTCHYQPEAEELDGLELRNDTPSPDIDIALSNRENSTIYVMSLKTSLKDRIKQSAYWRLKMKLPSKDDMSETFNSEMENTTPFNRKECNIQYGYVSPICSGGSSNEMLKEFDFGYVPEDKVDDSLDGQFSLPTLTEKVRNQKTVTQDVLRTSVTT